MDGLYLNQISCIEKWASPILNNVKSWEADNLHIDEIDGLKDIQRECWLTFSFFLFKKIHEKYMDYKPYLFFLHIPLIATNISTPPKIITKRWLERNFSEFSPPSFNITTQEYFEKFYSSELLMIPSELLFTDYNNLEDFLFFHRVFFSSDEGLYYNEIYVFSKSMLQAYEKN